MNKYFKVAADLLEEKKKLGSAYFRPAGDLDGSSKIDDINDYLLTIVSGERYPVVGEFGVLVDGGRTVVRLNDLKKMVDEGYNIVSANVINGSGDMIEIEYQKHFYDEKLMENRRIF